jgi:hypothetical protein
VTSVDKRRKKTQLIGKESGRNGLRGGLKVIRAPIEGQLEGFFSHFSCVNPIIT